MYRFLLCFCYLRTRYLAFICIVSVMLGVGTLIVVNSVMSGFSNKLKDRLHGILSDVRIDTDRTEGFQKTTDELTDQILRSPVGDQVEVLSPTVDVFALVQFQFEGQSYTHHVKLVGVDPVKQARVGGFSEYLVRQKGMAEPSFALTEEAMQRHAMSRPLGQIQEEPLLPRPHVADPFAIAQPPPAPVKDPFPFLSKPPMIAAPVQRAALPPPVIDPTPTPGLSGCIIGHSIAHFRHTDHKTGQSQQHTILSPGDEIFVTTVGASGTRPVSGRFVIADYFRSEMSEYDSSYLYVPLKDLQDIRGMGDHVNSMQLRLKDSVRNDDRQVHQRFVPALQHSIERTARTRSWQQQQGALLAAIEIERNILNLLLFLIIGVAGFGVLAIFSMIVSEKFRDIGILKSLGASSRGIMSIFLGYGLLLGTIGCGLGTLFGLLFTRNINEIEVWLTRLSGRQVFDRNVYYFDQIPTNVETWSVVVVNLGAVAIAVLFSILPAIRAARLQPVRALRFE